MELTNEQWNRIEPIILSSIPPRDPKGRKPRDPREVLNGILWILRTDAPWKDLPQRYPPYQTCHRRFQQWVRQGGFLRIAHELVEDLNERGKIDIREAFIDGSFAPAKKGVLLSARQSVAKAPRSWPSQTPLVFLPPLTLKALRHMRCSMSRQLLTAVLPGMHMKNWLAIKLMTAISLTISFEMSAVLKRPHRTAKDGKNHEPNIAGNCGVTSVDGRLSVCLPCFKTSGDWLFGTNTM